MANSFPAVSVAAVVLDLRSRVLLIQREQAPAMGLWNTPGGKLHYGEALRDACRREVRKETGIEITPGPLEEYPPAPVAGSDASDARWVPLSELHHRRVDSGDQDSV